MHILLLGSYWMVSWLDDGDKTICRNRAKTNSEDICEYS